MVSSHVGNIRGGSPLRLLGPNFQGRVFTTRASSGLVTAYTPTPMVVSSANDTTRFTYDIPTKINYIRNPRGDNSQQFWNTESSVYGLTRTYLGSGVEDGIPYTDIQFSGTATAGGSIYIGYDTPGAISALSGQPWAHSVYARILPGYTGATPPLGRPFIWYLNSSNSAIEVFSGTNANLTSFTSLKDARQSIVATGTNAATTGAYCPFGLFTIVSGSTYNFTLRVGGQQMEQSSTVSELITPPSGSPGVSYIARPRGILIEPTRTNFIRNPRMVGITAGTMGSGGVAPTNWTIATLTGLSLDVSSGTATGQTFISVRAYGTPTADGYISILMEPNNGISATLGQIFTYSGKYRISSGTLLSTSTSLRSRLQERGGSTSTASDTPLTYTTGLNWNNFQVTRTVSASDTTGIVPSILPYVTVANGAIDFTIQIMLPQVEMASGSTSSILPAAATVATSTRAQETYTYPLTTQTGTLAMCYSLNAINQASGLGFMSIDDGTDQNSIMIYSPPGSTSIIGKTVVAGVSSSPATILATASLSTRYAIGLRWSPGGVYAMLKNGSEVSLGPMPSTISTLRIGSSDPTNTMPFNGEVFNVDFYAGNLPLAMVLKRVN